MRVEDTGNQGTTTSGDMRELLSCPLSEIDEVVHAVWRLWKPHTKNHAKTAIKKWHITAAEYEPQFRTIRMYHYFDQEGSDKRLATYSLSFPYMQFALVDYDKKQRCLYVSMTNTPIKNLVNNDAFIIPLPNIGSRGSVCLGGKRPRNLQEAISLFWMMKFDDTPWHEWTGPKLAAKTFGNYSNWENFDLDNICTVPWAKRRSSKTNLIRFIENLWIGSDARYRRDWG